MVDFLKRRWQVIAIALLCLVLAVLGNCYASVSMGHEQELREAQDNYEWARQSLETSTEQLVEVRKKLVPRQFGSLDELKAWVYAWVEEYKPTVVSFGGRNYVIIGNDELYSEVWDCEDIAEAMQRRANIDGFLMSECLVDVDGCVYGVKVSVEGGHSGCMVVADGAYWFIEPQTGSITRIVDRDIPAPSWWEVLDVPTIEIPDIPQFELPMILGGDDD